VAPAARPRAGTEGCGPGSRAVSPPRPPRGPKSRVSVGQYGKPQRSIMVHIGTGTDSDRVHLRVKPLQGGAGPRASRVRGCNPWFFPPCGGPGLPPGSARWACRLGIIHGIIPKGLG
jgi:hypothetical protein